MIGQYVIVRTYSAGVFFGMLAERNGKDARLEHARRIWYWEGAASLSQLANEGTKEPGKCKFPAPVVSVILTEVIEILHVTEAARRNLSEVPEWRR